MRRGWFVVLVVIAGLVPTAAVDPLPGPASELELSPVADSGVATLTDRGRLRLEIDRLNGAARTRIAAAFRITHTGNGTTAVWLSAGADAVGFRALAGPVESPAEAVQLGSGESVTIGLVIDTTGRVPASADFRVNARVPDGEPDETTRVSEPSPGRVTLRVRDVPAGEPVRATLTAGEEPVEVEEIGVTTSRQTDVNLTVSTSRSPGPAPALRGRSVVEYVSVRHSTPGDAIAEAGFTFTVTKAALEARGLAPDDVTLYRYADRSWSPVPTTVVGATDEEIRFQASAPGLSVFAVGAAPPAGGGSTNRITDTPTVTATETTATETASLTASTETASPTATTAPTTATETASPTAAPATPTPTAPSESNTPTAAPDSTERPTTIDPRPTAGLFGFPATELAVLLAVVAVVSAVGVYRTRTN